MSENRVPVRDQAKPSRQSLRRSPTSGMAEEANDPSEALRNSRMRRRHARQSLHKDFLFAPKFAATPSADLQVNENGHTLNWQISDTTPVEAVSRTRTRSTLRTGCVVMALRTDRPAARRAGNRTHTQAAQPQMYRLLAHPGTHRASLITCPPLHQLCARPRLSAT